MVQIIFALLLLSVYADTRGSELVAMQGIWHSLVWIGGLALAGAALIHLLARLACQSFRRSDATVERALHLAVRERDDQLMLHAHQLAIASDLRKTRALTALSVILDSVVILVLLLQLELGGLAELLRDGMGIDRELVPLCGLVIYFAMQANAWWAHGRILRAALGDGSGGQDASEGRVMTYLRLSLIGVIPIVALQVLRFALPELFPVLRDVEASFESYHYLLLLCVPPVIYTMPAMLRLMLRHRELPAGVLRERLRQIEKRSGARVDKVFVWSKGRGSIPTAFYIGLGRPFRYVFISESLMEALNDDELEAVYAHELGHARFRHLWVLLAFMMGLPFAFQAFLTVLEVLPIESLRLWLASLHHPEASGASSMAFMWLLVPFMAAALWAIGYLSRRFERQADFFAARHVGARPLGDALLRVASLLGVSTRKQGWRHFSIDRRLQELDCAFGDPQVPEELRARRRRLTLRWLREQRVALMLLGLLLGASLALLTPMFQADYERGRRMLPVVQASRLLLDQPELLDQRSELAENMLAARRHLSGVPQSDSSRDLMQWRALVGEACAQIVVNGRNDKVTALRESIGSYAALDEQPSYLALLENAERQARAMRSQLAAP